MRLVVALMLAIWLGCGAAVAQEPGSGATEVTAGGSQGVPALVAIGVSGGFPAYQTVALTASLQVQFVGAQIKGSWTPAGPYFALQLRAYPPLEAPVPVFIGVGAGLYGSNVSYHAAVGTHVPLGPSLRLDAEAGLASVAVLGARRWAPHVAVGLSYAVPIEFASAPAGGAGEAGSRAGTTAGGCPAPRPPDEDALIDAFERVLDDWLRSARATYGSVYTDLDYGYSVTSSVVTGSQGTVAISYSGSVRAIGSGTVHEAQGDAAASFRWTGCTWSNTSVDY